VTVARFRSPDREVPWPDPARWQADVDALLARDAAAPPAPGAVLAVGSSSIVHWHPTLARDLAPLTVIPRGFGGSTINDLLHYTDRLVIPARPRAILVYEGDNDIGGGVFPETFAATYAEFLARIREELPETRVYVLAIKPSPSRWELWPRMEKANQLLAGLCAADPLVTYVDIATPMLDAAGQPRPELFTGDMLHMNEAGYALWTGVVRAVMVGAETARE
jgi:lysophospholipase L1-like esterase